MTESISFHRDFLKLAGAEVAGTAAGLVATPGAQAVRSGTLTMEMSPEFNVRTFGATGDGKTLDTLAINQAIVAANGAGGATVRIPAGAHLCHSIRLKSNVAPYLEPSAAILAASVSVEGKTSSAYDLAETNIP
jgi:polygalacturonase